MIMVWVLISFYLYETSYIFQYLCWIALLWSNILPWEACKIFNSLAIFFFCQRLGFNEMDYFRAWSIFLQLLCSCQNLYSNREIIDFSQLRNDQWTKGWLSPQQVFLKSPHDLVITSFAGRKKNLKLIS